MASTVKIEVKMTFKKSTPGTHVYVNETDGAAISQLYIRKVGFGNTEAPKEITVSIS